MRLAARRATAEGERLGKSQVTARSADRREAARGGPSAEAVEASTTAARSEAVASVAAHREGDPPKGGGSPLEASAGELLALGRGHRTRAHARRGTAFAGRGHAGVRTASSPR